MASANCARYVGATPTLVDIDQATFNIDPAAVTDGLEALVAVHYAGLPVDLDRARAPAALVIEDASHALGALTPRRSGRQLRAQRHVRASRSTRSSRSPPARAEPITTNDDDLALRLRRFRSHGIDRTPRC